MDLSKEEEKIVNQYRQKNKSKKKRKIKIQYTKLLLNILIVAFVIVGLSSIYINCKNGLGMDSIFESTCNMLKFVIPSVCAKSFFETKEEKKARLEYIKQGLENKYDTQNDV